MLISHFLVEATVLFSIILLAVSPLALRRYMGAMKTKS